MTRTTCEQVRTLLALGEAGAEEHLARCPDCARERSRIEMLLGRLRKEGSVDVPAGLDRQVRAALLGGAGGHKPVLRPAVGLVFSIASLGALIGGLSTLLAETSIGGLAPGVAYTLVIAYLMAGAAATSPILRRLAGTENR